MAYRCDASRQNEWTVTQISNWFQTLHIIWIQSVYSLNIFIAESDWRFVILQFYIQLIVFILQQVYSATKLDIIYLQNCFCSFTLWCRSTTSIYRLSTEDKIYLMKGLHLILNRNFVFIDSTLILCPSETCVLISRLNSWLGQKLNAV